MNYNNKFVVVVGWPLVAVASAGRPSWSSMPSASDWSDDTPSDVTSKRAIFVVREWMRGERWLARLHLHRRLRPTMRDGDGT